MKISAQKKRYLKSLERLSTKATSIQIKKIEDGEAKLRRTYRGALWLWAKVKWWLGPLIAIGGLVSIYFAGFFSKFSAPSMLLIDNKLLLSELVRLGLIFASGAMLCRLCAFFYSEADKISKDRAWSTRKTAPSFVMAGAAFFGVSIVVCQQLLVFGEYIRFLLQTLFISLLLYVIVVRRVSSNPVPRGTFASRLAKTFRSLFGRSREPDITITESASFIDREKRRFKLVANDPVFPGLLFVALALSTFLLGESRLRSILYHDPVEVFLSDAQGAENSIKGHLIGATSSGFLVAKATSEGPKELFWRLRRWVLGGHGKDFSLSLVPLDALSKIVTSEGINR